MRILSFISALALLGITSVRAEFIAGSALIDVTPTSFPVLVNGGFTSKTANSVTTPVSARSLAFSDGKEKIVMVVVDSCMIPRELIDEVKTNASKKAGIPTDHILISAVHTHSAPSCMSILGTEADPNYVPFLKQKLVEAITTPLENMRPAQIAWGEIDAADYTALRRWVIHPKFIREDPFGNPTVRANMHAATDWKQVTGVSGPEDPILSIIAVQSTEGKPIGLIANFSMHYFGDTAISADYFGRFSNGMQDKLDLGKTGFVAMMSQGCSGDVWRHDYEKTPTRGEKGGTIEEYSANMVGLAMKAISDLKYERPESISIAETRMMLPYRVPDKQKLEWGQRIAQEIGDRLPKTQTEVYAKEQIYLDAKKETEVVVQGIRLGDKIAIASTPTETYAISGLKIKAASPIRNTMVIELANGADGYIPPCEQHLLGGYNTWPARSAGLEVHAEAKITEAAIQMLEKSISKPRVDRRATDGPAAKSILARNPRAYWRLEEFAGPRVVDSSPNGLDAIYEPHIVYYLPGPQSSAYAKGGINRSAFFVGDRLASRVPQINAGDYTVALWFWSGTAQGVMDAPEWIFSRGTDFGSRAIGEHVGLKEDASGVRTLVYEGAGKTITSKVDHPVKRWHWHHLAIVRTGEKIQLFLDGVAVGDSTAHPKSSPADTLYFGGSCTGDENFEGRLDEIAVFDRALPADEIAKLVQEAATK